MDTITILTAGGPLEDGRNDTSDRLVEAVAFYLAKHSDLPGLAVGAILDARDGAIAVLPRYSPRRLRVELTIVPPAQPGNGYRIGIEVIPGYVIVSAEDILAGVDENLTS